jgi:hypothetical protein
VPSTVRIVSQCNSSNDQGYSLFVNGIVNVPIDAYCGRVGGWMEVKWTGIDVAHISVIFQNTNDIKKDNLQ